MKTAKSDTKSRPGGFEAVRDAILARALERAGKEGWSDELLISCAQGVDGDELRLAFPDGVQSLLSYFCSRGDAQALDILERDGLENMRIREKIAHGVKVRLGVDVDHKPAVRSAVLAFAKPKLAALGTRALYHTADCLWRAAGDDAKDYNHYTKRMILSGVYSSTLISWLSDKSDDHATAWAFLDARIENVMQFEKTKAQAGRLFQEAFGYKT